MKNPCVEFGFEATQVAPCAVQPGEPEWLLRFEPAHHGDLRQTPELPLSAICIAGVAPTAIRWVQVSCQAQTVFEIASHHGRSGHCCAAGEIVQAVAGMHGHAGMWISSQDCSPTLNLQGAAVRLRLRGEQSSGVVVRGVLG